MKKNSKGFFLAETIVVLALVTTTMAFVYPNVSKLYSNYSSRMNYYDQTQDILVLKEVYNSRKVVIEEETKGDCGDISDWLGVKKFENGDIEGTTSAFMWEANETSEDTLEKDLSSVEITKLYLTGYMTNVSSENYNFNTYLKRLRKVTSDVYAYRLIAIFSDDGNERYASIKITTEQICAIN